MDQGENRYRIIITPSGEESFREVLDFLERKYSSERFSQIANDLLDYSGELETFPFRGEKELMLSHRREEYRYILYKCSSRSTVKVFYYVDENPRQVYITGFFLTEMNPDKIDKIVH